MSLAVPISNSLTFVFTAISGWFVGEGRPNSREYLFALINGKLFFSVVECFSNGISN